jgi:hypothetical protein
LIAKLNTKQILKHNKDKNCLNKSITCLRLRKNLYFKVFSRLIFFKSWNMLRIIFRIISFRIFKGLIKSLQISNHHEALFLTRESNESNLNKMENRKRLIFYLFFWRSNFAQKQLNRVLYLSNCDRWQFGVSAHRAKLSSKSALRISCIEWPLI